MYSEQQQNVAMDQNTMMMNQQQLPMNAMMMNQQTQDQMLLQQYMLQQQMAQQQSYMVPNQQQPYMMQPQQQQAIPIPETKAPQQQRSSMGVLMLIVSLILLVFFPIAGIIMLITLATFYTGNKSGKPNCAIR